MLFQFLDDTFTSNLDSNRKSKREKCAKYTAHCDKNTFKCTLLQKAAKSGCINKTKLIINKIMDAREKHQKNMYFCKLFDVKLYLGTGGGESCSTIENYISQLISIILCHYQRNVEIQ